MCRLAFPQIPHALPTSPRLTGKTHIQLWSITTSKPTLYSFNPNNREHLLFTNIAMAPNWDRLIRFIATDGRELRGEPILPSTDFDVGTTTEKTELKAKVIHVANGDVFDPATKVTDETVTVKELLGPVTTEEVPIIRCIGLNFIKHSRSTQSSSHPTCIIEIFVDAVFSPRRRPHSPTLSLDVH